MVEALSVISDNCQHDCDDFVELSGPGVLPSSVGCLPRNGLLVVNPPSTCEISSSVSCRPCP